VVLLELALDLGVVAAGVGGQRRIEQLVLDGHVGGQGRGHGGNGPGADGVAALGRLVGLELALDPLVQGDQHPGRVGGGVDLDRPQDPGLPGPVRVEGRRIRLGSHLGASVSWRC
jgi:hypothetical protein